jgi:dihydroorotase
MKLLVRGGRVLDPSTGVDGRLDILIADGRIASLGRRLEAGDELPVIDATGLVVAPGFVDMHVHLREPGFEERETIATGGRAAARGGFTSVACMPNTNPVNDRREVTERILKEARLAAPVNVFPVAAVTMGLRGTELADLADLAAAGAVAFSDDGQPIMDSLVMRRALEIAKPFGTPIIDHCEDRALAAGGVMHEGRVSARLGLRGIPSAAEEIMVGRDIVLAEALGARVHIAHLSTRGSARAVREAKARGVAITAEATPHHLVLTDDLLAGRDPDFKMNPPLRSREDTEALLEALRDGTIDAVATDHAPHTREDKARGIEAAPFGIVGLETAVSVLLDRLVGRRVLSLGRLIGLLSANPARILGLKNKGRIAAGADADLTFLDLEKRVFVDRDSFLSKSRNTPFQGWKLRGAPVMTVVGGRIVYPIDAPEPAPLPSRRR